jgi:insulysin
LPDHNPFIPKNFDIKKEETEETKIVKKDDTMEVWYKNEVKYETPRTTINYNIDIPNSYCSPENAMYLSIYTSLINHILNKTLYHAELVGYSYSFYSTKFGFNYSFYGYSDKIFDLVLKSLKQGGICFQNVIHLFNRK